jgi:hypothetical protein
MRLRVFSALVAGVLFAGLAGAGSGAAKDVKIGSVSLTLPPPEGFCELTSEHPDEASVLKLTGDLVATMGGELLALSIYCGELDAWRAGNGAPQGDNAQYQTPNAARDADLPRARSVREFCAAVHAQGERILAELAPNLTARLEAAIQGLSVDKPTLLGVLAEDADACYWGMLMKARPADGGEVVQAVVSATTVVKGKIIFYNLYTIYHDTASVTAALARHRRNVPALLAANGG